MNNKQKQRLGVNIEQSIYVCRCEEILGSQTELQAVS